MRERTAKSESARIFRLHQALLWGSSFLLYELTVSRLVGRLGGCLSKRWSVCHGGDFAESGNEVCVKHMWNYRPCLMFNAGLEKLTCVLLEEAWKKHPFESYSSLFTQKNNHIEK